MEENVLVKVGLIGALIGVLLLLFVSERLSVVDASIANLSIADVDKVVKIKATVDSVRDTSSVLLLTVSDSAGSIKVVAFKDKDVLPIKKNDLVEVSGSIKEFRGKIEIEAKSITVF